jgi:rhamnosyltransferase
MAFQQEHPEPVVSVGILTRNGGAVFVKVLEALGRQKTDWTFEVVVLDSMSKDDTAKRAEAFGAAVHPYKPAKFRFGTARDTLFEKCRGKVIVTISQDVVPADEHWLARLAEPVLTGKADATVGEQTPPPGAYTFYWDYHASWLR